MKIMSNEEVKEVLMEVNLPARTYFANIIESCTGIDPKKAASLDFARAR